MTTAADSTLPPARSLPHFKVFSSCFSPDDRVMVLTTTNNHILKVDTRTMKAESSAALKEEKYVLNHVVVGADSRHVFVATNAGEVAVFDLDRMERREVRLDCDPDAERVFPDQRLRMAGHPNAALTVSIDHVHSRLLSGGQDSIVNIWDIPTATCLHAVDELSERVRGTGFSHDGEYFCAGDGIPFSGSNVERNAGGTAGGRNNFKLVIGESATGRVLHTLPLDGMGMRDCCWNPVRNALAYSFERPVEEIDRLGRKTLAYDSCVRVIGM